MFTCYLYQQFCSRRINNQKHNFHKTFFPVSTAKRITSWIKNVFLHPTEINRFKKNIFNTDGCDFSLYWNTSHSGKQKIVNTERHFQGNTHLAHTFMASLQFVYNYMLLECFFNSHIHTHTEQQSFVNLIYRFLMFTFFSQIFIILGITEHFFFNLLLVTFHLNNIIYIHIYKFNYGSESERLYSYMIHSC